VVAADEVLHALQHVILRVAASSGAATSKRLRPISCNHRLQIIARVRPVDIESIKAGGSVQVRVAAFSFSKTPRITGQIMSVSADTRHDSATKQPYFKVNGRLAKQDVPDTVINRLMPGMPTDVIMPKGERTLLQYILDPLMNAFAKSTRES
jgi:multidrug efflux pump subunit AcrA (membrane-fusion protein)